MSLLNSTTVPSFDDMLLVPGYSEIKTRAEVDLTTDLGKGIALSLPIVSAPMDTVTGRAMAEALEDSGGIGVIHRYAAVDVQSANVRHVSTAGKDVGAAVGVTGDYMARAGHLIESGVHMLCIDVAHGHHSLVKHAIAEIRSEWPDIHIMAGNIATYSAYSDLCEWGADSVRVGIGGGSACTTRGRTGHGVPTLSSVFDCHNMRRQMLATDPECHTAAIIADGGIRSSGDMVKALAAGADAVMIGSMLSGTDQAPGEFIVGEGGARYKKFRGMASRSAQQEWRGKSSSSEGVATTVPYKGCAKAILNDLAGAIRSGLSYSGAKNINELRGNARWIRQSGAAQVESSAHILR